MKGLQLFIIFDNSKKKSVGKNQVRKIELLKNWLKEFKYSWTANGVLFQKAEHTIMECRLRIESNARV